MNSAEVFVGGRRLETLFAVIAVQHGPRGQAARPAVAPDAPTA